jgi:hypothetical protein
MATVPSWQLKQASDGPFGDVAGTATIWDDGTLLVLYIVKEAVVVWCAHSGTTRMSA